VIAKGEPLMIDNKNVDYSLNTFNIKVINVETGNIFVNAIKEPGIAWTPLTRIKYILGLGLIWNKQDMLLETSKINFLAETAVKNIQSEIDSLNQKP